VIDESDSQPEKHDEQRISTLRGIPFTFRSANAGRY
jgi:hypothetical protein